MSDLANRIVKEQAVENVEQGVKLLYRGLYMLQKMDEIEALNSIDTLIKMLQEDRKQILQKMHV